jgi:hypothetical protein
MILRMRNKRPVLRLSQRPKTLKYTEVNHCGIISEICIRFSEQSQVELETQPLCAASSLGRLTKPFCLRVPGNVPLPSGRSAPLDKAVQQQRLRHVC